MNTSSTTTQQIIHEGSHPAGTPWRALPVLVAGVFLVVLDFFIVNVAMPSIQSDLHADSGQLEWVVAGYGLTLAGFLLTAGRLGDRYGRRRMFVYGVALFTLSSFLCALVNGPEMLIAARLVQGAGAALIMPTMLSMIGVLYQGPDRAKAISVYGMVMGVAAASGQIIGGALIQADPAGLGWRTIFAINVPIGIGILVLAPRLIPESRAEQTVRLDPLGMVLMTLSVATLVLPMIDGQQSGWPAWAWEMLAVSAVLLAVTIAQQRRLARRGGQPLFPPALVAVGAFRIGLTVQFAFWCGQASFYLFLALYLQQDRGLSALNSGLMFGILALAYLATSLKAPALVLSRGRGVVGAGALAITAGYAALVLSLAAGTDAPLWGLAPGLLLVGAGQGLCITPLTTVVLAHAEPAQAGAVSGALSTSQQLGNCVGVAVIGIVFFGDHGSGSEAFGWSLGALAIVSVLVLGLSWLLPRRARRAVSA